MISHQSAHVTTLSSPATGSHEPPTFKSRGVSVPFTTPILSGARARQSGRVGIELVTANPSGGKGVYVLQWSGVRALSTPTVHDTLLFQRLGGLSDLDPRGVRNAAVGAALEGYAGKDALKAAEKIAITDRMQQVQANFLLLQNLVNQVEPGNPTNVTTRTPEFDFRVNTVSQRVASSLQRPVSQLTAAMTAISEAFAPTGVAQHDNTARIPLLIDRLEKTCGALTTWANTDADQDLGGLATAVGTSIGTAAKWGRMVVASSRGLLKDPLALLTRYFANPDAVAALAERSDWLLDGWERVCLLWQVPCSITSRGVALVEMAQCLPALPREAFTWSNPALPIQAPDQNCRIISSDSRWRTGSSAFVMIERNEKLRAMSL